MLWKKINRFWKSGLIGKNKKHLLMVIIVSALFLMVGCSNSPPKATDIEVALGDTEISFQSEDDLADTESIAAIYRDIYEEAIETNTLGSLEKKQCIVDRLGENGYVAVDSENQIDMAGAEQTIQFCKAVEEKENASLTIIVIMELGIRKFDLETENGKVNIVRGYYQYDQNGKLKNKNTVSYPADFWQYTEEGYLIFEGSYFSDENYVLTLSDTPEHTALRVLPLSEKCRELNWKYILPVGYEQNNIFLVDWDEEDFGSLDFYDIFDNFYPLLYKNPVPYTANENLGVGSVYQIPGEIFENVIMTYFNIDKETLQSATTYSAGDLTYEYRPRGFYEVEYADIPYPEVVRYTENTDGTITLIINAVYPNENTSKAYSHETVIRLLDEGHFQYVSNRMISLEENHAVWWHSNRLTEEEWKEIYGGDE
jgi:PBP1b-binding outer membrane lipoprotein LpoB